MARTSMQMIAARLGVSKVTVSKALNNQPGVGEELRKQIFQVAQELEYLPPQERRQGIEKLIFLVPQRFHLKDESFYTAIFYDLAQECASAGFSIQLAVIDEAVPRRELDELIAAMDASAFFVGGEVSRGVLDALVKTGRPLVGIDFWLPSVPVDFVIVDNFMAGFRVTDHLIQRGHRRIGFVGDPSYTSNVADRWFGYQRAMLIGGHPVDPSWRLANNDRHGVYTVDFPLPRPLPTAFVCHCDMAAHHLIMKLNQSGVRVPEDASVISFDNTELSRRTKPLLTSLDIAKVEFARVALRQLKWRLSHPEAQFQTMMINTHIEERNSVLDLAPALQTLSGT